jgi:hypothetical protein
MSDTLDQLRRQWADPCPSLTTIREHYFAHIKTDRYLLQQIRSGQIQIKVTKLHNSARARPVVYLHDLAAYLDTKTRHTEQP